MIVNELDKRINELRPLVQKLVEKSESIDIDLVSNVNRGELRSGLDLY